MSSDSCNKIVDKFLNDAKLSTDMQLHVNSCLFCQETIAKIKLIESGDSPVAGMASPESFINNFNSGKLATSATGHVSGISPLQIILAALLLAAIITAGAYFVVRESAEKADKVSSSESVTIDRITVPSNGMNEDDGSVQHGSSVLNESHRQNEENVSGHKVEPGSVADDLFINPAPTDELD